MSAWTFKHGLLRSLSGDVSYSLWSRTDSNGAKIFAIKQHGEEPISVGTDPVAMLRDAAMTYSQSANRDSQLPPVVNDRSAMSTPQSELGTALHRVAELEAAMLGYADLIAKHERMRDLLRACADRLEGIDARYCKAIGAPNLQPLGEIARAREALK